MDEQLRQTARDAFYRLRLPERITLESLIRHLEDLRGRRIVIVETEKLTGKKICGLWIPREHVDVVYHSATKGTLHRQQLILHELSHMILRHDEAEGATWQGIAIFGELSGETVTKALARGISAPIWKQPPNIWLTFSRRRCGSPLRRSSDMRRISNDESARLGVYVAAGTHLVPARPRRPDNSMLKAAVVIAASLTTNINEVYLWAGALLPGANALDLVSNILLIIGVFYLSRAITRGAAAGNVRGRGAVWGRAGAVVTIVVMIVSFAGIDNPAPSTRFMLDYGDQPAAALYSAIQYVYIFAVMAATLGTCVRNVPQMRRRRFRAGFSIIGAGCGAALLLCVSVIVMDVTHVTGEEDLMRSVGGVYDVLYPLAVVLLAVGLAVPPLGKIINDIRIKRRIVQLEPQLTALWAKTVAQTPDVSLTGSAAGAGSARRKTPRDATDAIHRLVIEIHDWLAVRGNPDPELSVADTAALREAEALCLQQGRML
ncbi:hypothetical protein OL239_04060 [Arthrobacter sp. ATA002]|uniref:MAB_1171c family putative transporter n=1 Tax=Arthrobacter sp. ATA002 TaxID=2991715 RepID=UPI0022A70621|nr:MAB_1171c family putative transporter [Arthrobacter sp. ATA002]WAP52446.1 hypothetical protein OL239_04060 [Arthrobacter sp. ATA002]